MRKIKLIMTASLTIIMLNAQVLSAQTSKHENNKPKPTFVPQTEYEKKLVEFDKPKIGLFNNNTNNEYGENIAPKEFKVLNEMKMKESRRRMVENDGTKFDDEYDESLPVEDAGKEVSTFAQKRWTFYLPQQWKAYGDAFVTNKNEVGRKEKQFVGHAALGGYDRSMTLETWWGTVLHWRENSWVRPVKANVNRWTPGTHLYEGARTNGIWAQLRVNNATNAQYVGAEAYGDRNVGATYNWHFNAGYQGFYCSELVAFAWWYGANRDIIPQKKTWNAILPMDLYNSPETYVHRGGIV